MIGPKYLGHYTLDVSPSALEGSTYEIAILPDPDSFLRSSSSPPQAIPMGISMPCRLTIASCGPPTVTAAGPRYVAIVPPAGAGDVALRVTSLDEPCVDAFVDFDPNPSLAALGIARLVAAPVFRAPADWGVVYLGDEEILPDTEYTVRTVCATGSESAGESATTWLWGDVDDSGGSDFDDILCVLDAFAGSFANCSLYGVDLRGDVPNGVTDFDDVLAGLNAFGGLPYPGIDPCPGPPPIMDPPGREGPMTDRRPILGADDFDYPLGELETLPSDAGYDDDVAMRPDDGARIMLWAPRGSIRPGELLEVDVYVDQANDLRGYQVSLDIDLEPARFADREFAGGVHEEMFVIEEVFVDAGRDDYVFAGRDDLSAVDLAGGRLGAALLAGGVAIDAPAYLGTFVIRIAPGADLVFPDGVAPSVGIHLGAGTFLRDSSADPIAIANAEGVTITIARRDRGE
ncbi:MAG: hypothetical protein IIB61_09580 [Planctomycetes bacterium]|nr:hypothetical protein [Planctomycetota bacterium]